MQNTPDKESREYAFVRYLLNLIKGNKGIAAALRRADNPSLEYQSWEYLALFGIDLERQDVRLPHGLVAASLVKSKVEENGSLGLGEAIARCYEKRAQSDQARAKLRRLLACDTVEEVCRILRPMLQLINAKSSSQLNYAKLLGELLDFKWNPQKIRTRWAQNFYRCQENLEVSI